MTPASKTAYISEVLCTGCGICPKKCPFNAIQIVNLPTDMTKATTHRYAANSFKLHRLPLPQRGQVLGLVGSNGTGKTTALKILSGQMKPNLGRYDDPPEWDEIIKHFRGSELQNYFMHLCDGSFKVSIKPQYIENLSKVINGRVRDHLPNEPDPNGKVENVISLLELNEIMDREVDHLSGGELQRFAIAMTAVSDVDIYMFDEPSSYLDVKQRLNAAKAIRTLLSPSTYVMIVEHDLSVLDYMSDAICMLYGVPAVYGVITTPFSVREGINVFLDGYIPTENMRFRKESLTFNIAESTSAEPTDTDESSAASPRCIVYRDMQKTYPTFSLSIESGSFKLSEIVVMLGQNGTGKTTFMRMLAGKLAPDDESQQVPTLNVSYKPQKISPTFAGTVQTLFLSKIRAAFLHATFQSEVVKPLAMSGILDREVSSLSGGELQRVAIVLALGKPADIYLFDEPSAYLDSEQRVIAAKVIKRFIVHNKKGAFIVEHDFIMATYLADSVIVFDGKPSVQAFARKPETLLTGMNRFLNDIQITFRRDATSFRPRINKSESVKDKDRNYRETTFS